MPRGTTLQQSLEDLLAEVIDLGKEVENSIETMLRAMETRDADLAQSELGVDARYKARGAEAERDCMILQASRAMAAQHLGHIYTVQSVTNHLVRSGTLCEHICRAIAETEGQERDQDLEAVIIEMARTARNVFHEGLEIFENRDMDRARNLEARDDKVDLLYSEAMNLIANPSDGGGGAPEWRMRAALIVHYLERISDHGVDIGERTIFLVSGERIEDAMQQYLDRNADHEADNI
jgi:phosphate transport system protein